MKHLFAVAILMGLLLTGTGRAQFGPGPKYDPSEVTALVDQVHNDLNHAYAVFHFSGEDRERLNKPEKDSREFAQKWAKGKFDKDQLDDVISSIQHVLDNNKLPVDARDSISKDLAQLRNMRDAYDHHEIGGTN
jgi:cell division septum initiation protein DivIVA